MGSLLSQMQALAAPWARLYNGSSAISTLVTFAHLGGILVAGGFAIVTDHTTLRLHGEAWAVRRAHLDTLHAMHRPVLLGLALTLVSGLLLLGADLETLLPAPIFWVKMAVIVFLLGNGAVLHRTETALRAGCDRSEKAWRRLRRSAAVSLTLWFGSLLLGTALLAG